MLARASVARAIPRARGVGVWVPEPGLHARDHRPEAVPRPHLELGRWRPVPVLAKARRAPPPLATPGRDLCVRSASPLLAAAPCRSSGFRSHWEAACSKAIRPPLALFEAISRRWLHPLAQEGVLECNVCRPAAQFVCVSAALTPQKDRGSALSSVAILAQSCLTSTLRSLYMVHSSGHGLQLAAGPSFSTRRASSALCRSPFLAPSGATRRWTPPLLRREHRLPLGL